MTERIKYQGRHATSGSCRGCGLILISTQSITGLTRATLYALVGAINDYKAQDEACDPRD